MFRLLTIFTLVIGFVAGAWADIPAPPPPTGKKYVSVHNQVRLGKEFDDYVFVVAHGVGPGAPRYTYKKIALSTKSATSMPGGGRYQYIQLLAVPKASADQALANAPGAPVGPGTPAATPPGALKIEKLPRIGFADTATVDSKHPGNSVTRTYTITGVDQDGKIQTTVEREPADPEAEKRSDSRSEVGPSRTSTAVAGIALALSFAIGGIWLVRNRRAR